MESFIEFYESNQQLFRVVIFVIGLIIFIVAINFFNKKARNNSLNNSDYNEDDIDEDDGYENDEELGERFFRIPSYNLPEDWGETFGVIVDRKTGVQYLCYGDYGITPFIDSDGKPILYKDEEEEQEESE